MPRKIERLRDREVHRVRVDLLVINDAAEGTFWRCLHGLLNEGQRRGFVVSASTRKVEKIEDGFPVEKP